MTKQRIQVNFRVLRDEGETVVITPVNDEVRIRKPNRSVTVNSSLTVQVVETDLKPVGQTDRPSWFGK